jgi:predicted kinase
MLLIGNIASGKSTFAKKMDKAGFRCVSSDAIRYMFHPREYVFDEEEGHAILETEKAAVNTLMELGFNVCVDDAGSAIKHRREWLVELAKKHCYKLVAVKMPFVEKGLSVKRRMKNNHGKYDKVRWGQVYEMFQNNYIPPTVKEGFYGVFAHNSSSLRDLFKIN